MLTSAPGFAINHCAVGASTQHGHEAILQRVVAEDIGELGADHGLEAVVRQRPRRMLTRRAAAEVVAGDQNRAALGFGPVQREVGTRVALLVVAPLGEEVLAKPFTSRRAQKTRGNDLVGVDVRQRQYSRARTDGFDGFHDSRNVKLAGEQLAGIGHLAAHG